LSSESIAEARLQVVSKDGAPFDRVAFVSLKETNDPTGGEFRQLNALRVKPFDISLARGANVTIPRLTVPYMTGPITDFVTYWVALSARTGIDALHTVGATCTASQPFGGTWANGSTTPVGHDKLQVVSALIAEDATTVTFRSVFAPPRAQAMKMAYPWMREPVSSEAPNNFEQVREASNGSFLAMWGSEDFTITTQVKSDTGLIERASMTNHLSLRIRTRCDAGLQACGPEIPSTITREEVLTLLP
ncbi:MAG TPA: hypothetical protein VL354_14685, partial [Spirochaetia bacterium]|nr:hypothetical protein [Spirochaetia bacterium]